MISTILKNPRVVLALVVALLGMALVALVLTRAIAVKPMERIAFVPELTHDDAWRPLTTVHHLVEGSVYSYLPDATLQRVSTPALLHSPASASVGVGDSLIATLGVRPRRADEVGLSEAQGIAVITTFDGQVRALRDRATEVSWSPDGSRVVFLIGRMREGRLPSYDSVVVWSARGNSYKTFNEQPYQVGWLNADTLLLDYRNRLVALDRRSGTTVIVPHHGVFVSPSRHFSMSARPESPRRVWDDRSGSELTSSVEARIGGAIRSYPDPVWVQSEAHGSWLAIQVCLDAPGATMRNPGRSACSVKVVDLDAMIIVKSIPGKAVAFSPDRKSVLLHHKGILKVVGLE